MCTDFRACAGARGGKAVALAMGHTQFQGDPSAYKCPGPIHLSPDLTTNSFYSDSEGSIIDPVKRKAYQENSGPVKQLGEEAVDAADAFLTTWSRQAAECVLTLEKTAAQDRALTGKMSQARRTLCRDGWLAHWGLLT